MLKLPAGQSWPVLPYLFTLIPPVVLSLLDPEIFFKALDFAGTYGGVWINFHFAGTYSFVKIMSILGNLSNEYLTTWTFISYKVLIRLPSIWMFLLF